MYNLEFSSNILQFTYISSLLTLLQSGKNNFIVNKENLLGTSNRHTLFSIYSMKFAYKDSIQQYNKSLNMKINKLHTLSSGWSCKSCASPSVRKANKETWLTNHIVNQSAGKYRSLHIARSYLGDFLSRSLLKLKFINLLSWRQRPQSADIGCSCSVHQINVLQLCNLWLTLRYSRTQPP